MGIKYGIRMKPKIGGTCEDMSHVPGPLLGSSNGVNGDDEMGLVNRDRWGLWGTGVMAR